MDEKELHNAISAAQYTTLPDYLTPTGEIIEANKELWIESCPLTLIFQIRP
jgi:hypothetical protein